MCGLCLLCLRWQVDQRMLASLLLLLLVAGRQRGRRQLGQIPLQSTFAVNGPAPSTKPLLLKAHTPHHPGTRTPPVHLTDHQAFSKGTFVGGATMEGQAPFPYLLRHSASTVLRKGQPRPQGTAKNGRQFLHPCTPEPSVAPQYLETIPQSGPSCYHRKDVFLSPPLHLLLRCPQNKAAAHGVPLTHTRKHLEMLLNSHPLCCPVQL